MAYKIHVKSIQGTILTFTVEAYDIEEGDFVCFIDEKTDIPKRFHASNCEISEVRR